MRAGIQSPRVHIHERREIRRWSERHTESQERVKEDMCVLGSEERQGNSRSLRKGLGRGRPVMPAGDRFGEPLQLPVRPS